MKEHKLDIDQTYGGIYIYYFRNTGKDDCEQSYVGSTTNFKKRHSEHTNLLKKGTHRNLHLQNIYNKFGEDNMEYEQLEHMSFPESYSGILKRDYLESREFYWYNLLGSKLNLVVPGESIVKSLLTNKPDLFGSNKKEVYLVDGHLNIIEKYNGVREAGRALGIESTGISTVARALGGCTKGYIFRYEEFLKVLYVKKSFKGIKGKSRTELKKPILCYDLSGEFVSEYDSIVVAAQTLKLQESGINRCCSGESKHCGRYIFRLKGSSLPVREVLPKRLSSVVCLKEGIFYKEYKSCNDAQKDLGIGRGLIHHRCNNRPSHNITIFDFYYKEGFNKLNQQI